MNPDLLDAFAFELDKLAVSPAFGARVGSMLGGAGSLGGVGSLVGAGLGGAYRGYQGYRDAKNQGATTGQAVASGVAGGLGGAMSGAAAGGIVGGVGGAVGGALNPAKMEAARKALTNTRGPVGAFSRFGQRQVHAVTGWHPGGDNLQKGMDEIRHGAYGARQHMNALTEKGVTGAGLEGAQKRLQAAETAERMGLTSVPGYVRSMRDNGIGATLRAGVDQQLHGADAATKALTFGLPAAGVAQTLAEKEDPNKPHKHSKAVRVLGHLANAGTGLVFGGLPQATQMLTQSPLQGLTQ